jgi:hypothetical protein
MPDPLEIDPADYRTLLEMVNLATYVSQYHARGGREDWLEAFDTLSDKILARAEEFGCGDLVEEDAESDHLVPVLDYEEESFYKECVDDMLDRCFWEDLVGRLSDRDMARSMGKTKWENLPEAEKAKRREKQDQVWWKEFESNGIENLECIRREPHG